MDQFIGSWKLVSSENFDKYLDALGADEEVGKFLKCLNQTFNIYRENHSVAFETKTAVANQKFSFKLGKEFTRPKNDGINCKATVNLEEDKLVQVLKWDGKQTHYIYEIKDGQLLHTMTYQDVKALRIFEKV